MGKNIITVAARNWRSLAWAAGLLLTLGAAHARIDMRLTALEQDQGQQYSDQKGIAEKLDSIRQTVGEIKGRVDEISMRVK